jgi:hypothetical protein
MDEFLSKNTIASIDGKLPLVHSTKSLNLRELVAASGLNPTDCDVYDEKLLYFFLGRPAYRWDKPQGRPQHWELPTCLVFDQLPELKIERTLPFDAVRTRKSCIQVIFRTSLAAILRVPIQALQLEWYLRFYGNFPDYVSGKPKSENELVKEFDLGPLDAEVLAIRTLGEDGSGEKFDDRCFTVEIQTKSSVNFGNRPPSAVYLATQFE